MHTHTQRFIEDWRARRGDRRLPSRPDLTPAVFGRLVPQLFMLGVEADRREVFRLAGSFLTDLHGLELHGTRFAGLWRAAEHRALGRILAMTRRSATPVVLAAQAYPDLGEPVGLEITLAPVLGPTGRVDRLFGLYQPTSMTARLRGRPVRNLELRAAAPALEESAAAGPRLVAVDGRRVA